MFSYQRAIIDLRQARLWQDVAPFVYISFPGQMTIVLLIDIALLGEADVLSGEVICPRSPPDLLASFANITPSPEEWIIQGACAFVQQVSSVSL